jgi:hypothetical protein
MIAGMQIELQSSIAAAAMGIEERLGPFFSNGAGGTIDSIIRWTEGAADTVSGRLIYDPGDIWRMYHDEGAQAYHARIEYPGPAEQRTRALLAANATWSDLSLVEMRSGTSWRSLLAVGAGELIVRTRILFRQGIVFHSSGIDDNGRGILFVGHSGAGKSTQASLWAGVPGVCAMNDDRIAVRLDGPRAIAYGLPWGGTEEIARNHQAPLSAVFVLEQAPENAVRRLTTSSSVPLLLPRAFLPYWDEDLLDLALQTINALVDRVPIYALQCRPDLSVVPVVRSVL